MVKPISTQELYQEAVRLAKAGQDEKAKQLFQQLFLNNEHIEAGLLYFEYLEYETFNHISHLEKLERDDSERLGNLLEILERINSIASYQNRADLKDRLTLYFANFHFKLAEILADPALKKQNYETAKAYYDAVLQHESGSYEYCWAFLQMLKLRYEELPAFDKVRQVRQLEDGIFLPLLKSMVGNTDDTNGKSYNLLVQCADFLAGIYANGIYQENAAAAAVRRGECLFPINNDKVTFYRDTAAKYRNYEKRNPDVQTGAQPYLALDTSAVDEFYLELQGDIFFDGSKSDEQKQIEANFQGELTAEKFAFIYQLSLQHKIFHPLMDYFWDNKSDDEIIELGENILRNETIPSDEMAYVCTVLGYVHKRQQNYQQAKEFFKLGAEKGALVCGVEYYELLDLKKTQTDEARKAQTEEKKALIHKVNEALQRKMEEGGDKFVARNKALIAKIYYYNWKCLDDKSSLFTAKFLVDAWELYLDENDPIAAHRAHFEQILQIYNRNPHKQVEMMERNMRIFFDRVDKHPGKTNPSAVKELKSEAALFLANEFNAAYQKDKTQSLYLLGVLKYNKLAAEASDGHQAYLATKFILQYYADKTLKAIEEGKDATQDYKFILQYNLRAAIICQKLGDTANLADFRANIVKLLTERNVRPFGFEAKTMDEQNKMASFLKAIEELKIPEGYFVYAQYLQQSGQDYIGESKKYYEAANVEGCAFKEEAETILSEPVSIVEEGDEPRFKILLDGLTIKKKFVIKPLINKDFAAIEKLINKLVATFQTFSQNPQLAPVAATTKADIAILAEIMMAYYSGEPSWFSYLDDLNKRQYILYQADTTSPVLYRHYQELAAMYGSTFALSLMKKQIYDNLTREDGDYEYIKKLAFRLLTISQPLVRHFFDLLAQKKSDTKKYVDTCNEFLGHLFVEDIHEIAPNLDPESMTAHVFYCKAQLLLRQPGKADQAIELLKGLLERGHIEAGLRYYEYLRERKDHGEAIPHVDLYELICHIDDVVKKYNLQNYSSTPYRTVRSYIADCLMERKDDRAAALYSQSFSNTVSRGDDDLTGLLYSKIQYLRANFNSLPATKRIELFDEEKDILTYLMDDYFYQSDQRKKLIMLYACHVAHVYYNGIVDENGTILLKADPQSALIYFEIAAQYESAVSLELAASYDEQSETKLPAVEKNSMQALQYYLQAAQLCSEKNFSNQLANVKKEISRVLQFLRDEKKLDLAVSLNDEIKEKLEKLQISWMVKPAPEKAKAVKTAKEKSVTVGHYEKLAQNISELNEKIAICKDSKEIEKLKQEITDLAANGICHEPSKPQKEHKNFVLKTLRQLMREGFTPSDRDDLNELCRRNIDEAIYHNYLQVKASFIVDGKIDYENLINHQATKALERAVKNFYPEINGGEALQANPFSEALFEFLPIELVKKFKDKENPDFKENPFYREALKTDPERTALIVDKFNKEAQNQRLQQETQKQKEERERKVKEEIEHREAEEERKRQLEIQKQKKQEREKIAAEIREKQKAEREAQEAAERQQKEEKAKKQAEQQLINAKKRQQTLEKLAQAEKARERAIEAAKIQAAEKERLAPIREMTVFLEDRQQIPKFLIELFSEALHSADYPAYEISLRGSAIYQKPSRLRHPTDLDLAFKIKGLHELDDEKIKDFIHERFAVAKEAITIYRSEKRNIFTVNAKDKARHLDFSFYSDAYLPDESLSWTTSIEEEAVITADGHKRTPPRNLIKNLMQQGYSEDQAIHIASTNLIINPKARKLILRLCFLCAIEQIAPEQLMFHCSKLPINELLIAEFKMMQNNYDAEKIKEIILDNAKSHHFNDELTARFIGNLQAVASLAQTNLSAKCLGEAVALIREDLAKQQTSGAQPTYSPRHPASQASARPAVAAQNLQ